jgi:hypothetical protein
VVIEGFLLRVFVFGGSRRRIKWNCCPETTIWLAAMRYLSGGFHILELGELSLE